VLVIRRRAGESIRVGDDVEIQIIECSPTRVKLGIQAPPEVPVMRTEVRLTREQNLAAARSMQWFSKFAQKTAKSADMEQ
jgi:carbon storage regulator